MRRAPSSSTAAGRPSRRANARSPVADWALRRGAHRATPSPAVVLVEHRQADGRGSARATRSETKTRLPSDLDILVPSRPTRPTWTQCRTNGPAGHRLALRRLALVVREGEVAPSAVHVDGLAELAAAPAPNTRCASPVGRPPARLPGGLVLKRRLPEDEVKGVALARVLGFAPCSPASSSIAVAVLVTDLTEARELRDLEVHRSVDLVGDTRSKVAPISERISGIAPVARGSA